MSLERRTNTGAACLTSRSTSPSSQCGAGTLLQQVNLNRAERPQSRVRELVAPPLSNDHGRLASFGIASSEERTSSLRNESRPRPATGNYSSISTASQARARLTLLPDAWTFVVPSLLLPRRLQRLGLLHLTRVSTATDLDSAMVFDSVFCSCVSCWVDRQWRRGSIAHNTTSARLSKLGATPASPGVQTTDSSLNKQGRTGHC